MGCLVCCSCTHSKTFMTSLLRVMADMNQQANDSRPKHRPDSFCGELAPDTASEQSLTRASVRPMRRARDADWRPPNQALTGMTATVVTSAANAAHPPTSRDSRSMITVNCARAMKDLCWYQMAGGTAR